MNLCIISLYFTDWSLFVWFTAVECCVVSEMWLLDSLQFICSQLVQLTIVVKVAALFFFGGLGKMEV
jgi:hypothetical protein